MISGLKIQTKTLRVLLLYLMKSKRRFAEFKWSHDGAISHEKPISVFSIKDRPRTNCILHESYHIRLIQPVMKWGVRRLR